MPVPLPPAPKRHDAQNQNQTRATIMRVLQSILRRIEAEELRRSG